MTHEETRARFSELLDGALAPEEALPVEEHLAGCAECRGEWEAFRGAFAALKVMPRGEAPGTIADRVKRTINRRSRGAFFPEQSPLLFRVPYEFISLILILMAVIFFLILTAVSDIAPDRGAGDAGTDAPAETEPPAPAGG